MKRNTAAAATAAAILALGVSAPVAAERCIHGRHAHRRHSDRRRHLDHLAGRCRSARHPDRHCRTHPPRYRWARYRCSTPDWRVRSRLGGERHLHRAHADLGADHRGRPDRLHRRDDHQGRYRHLHREQPAEPDRRRTRDHRDRDHRKQLRHLEPDDQRARRGKHGCRGLHRHHHPLGPLDRGVRCSRICAGSCSRSP